MGVGWFQTISLEGDAHAQRRRLFRFAVMAIVAAERSKRRPAFSLRPVRPEALRNALRAGLLTRIWRSLGLREGPLPRFGNLPVQRTRRSALKAASCVVSFMDVPPRIYAARWCAGVVGFSS